MSKLKEKLKNLIEFVKEGYFRGKKWIGYDGLLNMESSALMLIILIIFLEYHWAIIVTSFVAGLKCFIDYKNGHENEKHDLICSAIGIVVGFMIVIALML